MKYKITDIIYDTDGESVCLPDTLEIHVPPSMTDEQEIDDYLSDEISNITMYCHKGFSACRIHPEFETIYKLEIDFDDIMSESKILRDYYEGLDDYHKDQFVKMHKRSIISGLEHGLETAEVMQIIASNLEPESL